MMSGSQCEESQCKCQPVRLMVAVWLCGLKAGCVYSHRKRKSDHRNRSLPQGKPIDRQTNPAHTLFIWNLTQTHTLTKRLISSALTLKGKGNDWHQSHQSIREETGLHWSPPVACVHLYVLLIQTWIFSIMHYVGDIIHSFRSMKISSNSVGLQPLTHTHGGGHHKELFTGAGEYV